MKIFLLASFLLLPLLVYSFLPSVPTEDITLTLSSTSRQVVAQYVAPDTTPCTVEASESNTYTPLVNDINTALFSGSSSDNRSGSLGAGNTARTFILGTLPDMRGVIANLASDGKRYGRALQPSTTYYVRVTCGSHTGTASIATKNRPLGMTRADEQPMASAGVYAFPTINATDRTQTISDPVTGVLLRKMTVPSEDTIGGQISFLASGAPWPWAQSTINDGSGTPGYLNTMPTENGTARLYFVTQSASRFLGTIIETGLSGFGTNYGGVINGSHFGTDPTKLFFLMPDLSGNVHVTRCQLPASGDVYYNTSVAPDTTASCTWADQTPNPNNLSALALAFDATFNNTKFVLGTQQWMQGNYLMFIGWRGSQDTYGWIGAVDTSTTPATLAGLAPLWERGGSGTLSFRWCGIHTSHAALGTNNMSFTAKTMYQDIKGSYFTTTLNGGINNSQTTVTLTSNTPLGNNGIDHTENIGYDIAAGDEIWIDSEVLYITSFVSGTTWNVTRGVAGSVGASHSNGAVVIMACRCHNPSDVSQVGPSWWNFIVDPHGTDTTGTNLITQLANDTTYNGHEGFANGRGIAEGGWYGFVGPAMTNNSVFLNSDSPQFAGASKNASGNAWQKHAGASQQTNADSTQSLVWGVDGLALDTDVELRPTSLTNVTGSLWKWVNTNYTLSRKKLSMIAISGIHPLLDISSTATGDVIDGTSASNYKYCVANAVNECRAGSVAGDIYINSPDLILIDGTLALLLPERVIGISSDILRAILICISLLKVARQSYAAAQDKYNPC